jgi:general secretion pathway protein F
MPTFTYNALSSLGQSVSGELDAEHERAALRELKRRGLTPLSLAIAAQASRRLLSWKGLPRPEDHIRLLNELAVLVEAGVGLGEAIDIAARSPVYNIFGDTLGGLGRDLRRGMSVPDAMRANVKTFPIYVYQLIEAGNETGMLTAALKDASLQMQFDERVRKDIRNALIYPMFLIVMGTAATLFIFLFVVPRFAGMMQSRLQLLPPFSRGVFVAGMFLREHMVLVAAVLVVALVTLVVLLRQPLIRARARELAVRLPVIGKMFAEAEAGRWTAMLATLLQNRVPLVQSLALARDSLLLESFKAKLGQIERAVRGGSALGAALADYRIFDDSLVNLVKVGERSGRLAEMLKSAANLAEQKGRDRIKRLMALLEPVSILVIGCMIGVIVISLFTAITSINNVPL